MPERRERLSDVSFIRFLRLLKESTLTEHRKSVSAVHCIGVKIGVLAHLPISTSFLVSYSRASDPRASLAFFHETPEKDLVLCNAMMSALVENCCFREAQEFFMDRVRNNQGFDSTSLLIVLSSSARTGQLVAGRVLHGLALRSGLESDLSFGNVLIDFYAKCGNLTAAECCFQWMQCRDTITWNTIITGCLYNNEPDMCLVYFHERCLYGDMGDVVSLSSAISAASCLAEASLGQALHGLVIKVGIMDTPSTSVANSLVTMYSICGDCDAAENVFKGVAVHMDVVSWNAIIDGYATNRKISEAFNLVHWMLLSETLRPDKITLLNLVSACADEMLLSEGKALHGIVARRGLNSDLLLTNGLMDMYMRCHCVDKAEILFDLITQKDLVSWNTMICGYSWNGLIKPALMMYKRMLILNSGHNVTSLLAVLPSCYSSEYLRFGESVHCLQVKIGMSQSLAVDFLMHMYIGSGNVAAAFLLLSRNLSHGDVSCWNTFIAGCTKNYYFGEALEAFKLMMRQRDTCFNSVTLGHAILAAGNLNLGLLGKCIHGVAMRTPVGCETRVLNALVTMYGRCEDIGSARLVFSSDPNTNLCSWNCMISVLCQNKFATEAIELFRHLDFLPDEITLTSILSACSELSFGRRGMEIHARAFRLGFCENSFISTALIDMYSNCGMLDSATSVFRTSRSKSVTTWNSMIGAYGFHGHGNEAIEVFKNMLDIGMKATGGTLVSLLTACSHSGLVAEGVWYYVNMSAKYGVECVTEHWVCVVDMLGRSGRLSEAYEMIKKMDKADPGVWGALLSSCRIHGKLDMAREVAEVLFNLDPVNSGYYISLYNMYVADGRWEDAVELREELQAKRLGKPIACSVIDVV
ncbi:hypothetical protein MLD38_039081 [Melastoma candidum]|uniref:Uncharacterized protein n=1 Tax=Melastoma candidum TaxID=119954 RepID=A0ACB9L1N6_9MYRT|nr:hypothetical protein MLD38_039081 [Melastoma candidum]